MPWYPVLLYSFRYDTGGKREKKRTMDTYLTLQWSTDEKTLYSM